MDEIYSFFSGDFLNSKTITPKCYLYLVDRVENGKFDQELFRRSVAKLLMNHFFSSIATLQQKEIVLENGIIQKKLMQFGIGVPTELTKDVLERIRQSNEGESREKNAIKKAKLEVKKKIAKEEPQLLNELEGSIIFKLIDEERDLNQKKFPYFSEYTNFWSQSEKNLFLKIRDENTLENIDISHSPRKIILNLMDHLTNKIGLSVARIDYFVLLSMMRKLYGTEKVISLLKNMMHRLNRIDQKNMIATGIFWCIMKDAMNDEILVQELKKSLEIKDEEVKFNEMHDFHIPRIYFMDLAYLIVDWNHVYEC